MRVRRRSIASAEKKSAPKASTVIRLPSALS